VYAYVSELFVVPIACRTANCHRVQITAKQDFECKVYFLYSLHCMFIMLLCLLGVVGAATFAREHRSREQAISRTGIRQVSPHVPFYCNNSANLIKSIFYRIQYYVT